MDSESAVQQEMSISEGGERRSVEGRERDCFLCRKDLIKFTSVQPTQKDPLLLRGGWSQVSALPSYCRPRREIHTYVTLKGTYDATFQSFCISFLALPEQSQKMEKTFENDTLAGAA